MIRKASGTLERFSREKLLSSLLASGLSEASAEEVVAKVEGIPGIGTTRELYDAVRRVLLETDPVAAARYSLKDAMMRLGPTGFPFEEFAAEVLRSLGHRVETHRFIRGRCVTHEIDLIIDGSEIGECKYHNERGIYTGLKEAMYTYMRFLDIREVRDLSGVVLITNTKFSREAREFSSCYRLELLGWKYPPGGGLERLIEESGTYPVTVLSGLMPEEEIRRLLSSGIVTVRQLLERGGASGRVIEVAKGLLEFSRS